MGLAARPAASSACREASSSFFFVWSGAGLQAADANPLQKALLGRVPSTQTIAGGELRNFANLLPGVSVRTLASCSASSPERSSVDIQDVWLQLGGLK